MKPLTHPSSSNGSRPRLVLRHAQSTIMKLPTDVVVEYIAQWVSLLIHSQGVKLGLTCLHVQYNSQKKPYAQSSVTHNEPITLGKGKSKQVSAGTVTHNVSRNNWTNDNTKVNPAYTNQSSLQSKVIYILIRNLNVLSTNLIHLFLPSIQSTPQRSHLPKFEKESHMQKTCSPTKASPA